MCFGVKCEINCRTEAEVIVKKLAESERKSLSTVKQMRKKPLLKKQHKKTDYSLQMYSGIKTLTFEDICYCLIKLKLECWAIKTTIKFEGKWQAWESCVECALLVHFTK
ncbi:hypothetical protein AMECASPLE_020093 [Ameca splendens]|uniref:Uncharacterized protein n=1 Tax=Ameca splendens TaxID=208324 RepID=A0ABV0ZYV9_9TELE